VLVSSDGVARRKLIALATLVTQLYHSSLMKALSQVPALQPSKQAQSPQQ